MLAIPTGKILLKRRENVFYTGETSRQSVKVSLAVPAVYLAILWGDFMGVTESILHHQITHGILDNEAPMVRGIAQLAVDNGFTALSGKQRAVLEPFLTQHCSGVTDPGGYHNDCGQTLTDDDLLDAYQQSDDSESLECESCRSESSFYANRRDKLEKE